MNDILIVSGSHKNSGSSGSIAARMSELVATHIPGGTAEGLSLADLPFWDEGMWGDTALAGKWDAWRPVADRLRRADALVVIAPEYGGMVPPKLMNFLLLCSGDEIGHKPALAVGVSSTRGGAYPITQLRSYGYKNNHVCWIPDHLIVRNVDIAADGPPLPETSYEGKYAVYCLKLLDAYSSALKLVRNSGTVDHRAYPYGL